MSWTVHGWSNFSKQTSDLYVLFFSSLEKKIIQIRFSCIYSSRIIFCIFFLISCWFLKCVYILFLHREKYSWSKILPFESSGQEPGSLKTRRMLVTFACERISSSLLTWTRLWTGKFYYEKVNRAEQRWLLGSCLNAFSNLEPEKARGSSLWFIWAVSCRLRVLEVRSGCPGAGCVCVVTTAVVPRGTQRTPPSVLGIPGPHKCLQCLRDALELEASLGAGALGAAQPTGEPQTQRLKWKQALEEAEAAAAGISLPTYWKTKWVLFVPLFGRLSSVPLLADSITHSLCGGCQVVFPFTGKREVEFVK